MEFRISISIITNHFRSLHCFERREDNLREIPHNFLSRKIHYFQDAYEKTLHRGRTVWNSWHMQLSNMARYYNEWRVTDALAYHPGFSDFLSRLQPLLQLCCCLVTSACRREPGGFPKVVISSNTLSSMI